jgi:hypothetical protein
LSHLQTSRQNSKSRWFGGLGMASNRGLTKFSCDRAGRSFEPRAPEVDGAPIRKFLARLMLTAIWLEFKSCSKSQFGQAWIRRRHSAKSSPTVGRLTVRV